MFFLPFIFHLIRHQILKETEVQTLYHLSEIRVPGSLIAVNYFFKKCKCVSISEIGVKWEETQNNSKCCPEPWRSLSHHRPTRFSRLGGKTLAKIIFQLGQSICWKDDLIYFVSSSHISCEELLLLSSLKPTVILVREVSGRHNVKIK